MENIKDYMWINNRTKPLKCLELKGPPNIHPQCPAYYYKRIYIY